MGYSIRGTTFKLSGHSICSLSRGQSIEGGHSIRMAIHLDRRRYLFYEFFIDFVKIPEIPENREFVFNVGRILDIHQKYFSFYS